MINKKNRLSKTFIAVLLSLGIAFSGLAPFSTMHVKAQEAVIASAEPLDDSVHNIHLTFRIDEDVLKSMFPDTLEVTLSDGSISSVPVSWETPDDYSEESVYLYVYDPVIEGYEIAEGTDLPYIIVWIDEADTVYPDLDYCAPETDIEYPVDFEGEGNLQDLVDRDAQVDRAANEMEIFQYLTNDLGLNEAGAVGVLANIRAESGYRQNALGDKNSAGVYTSYGLCQWHNQRWANLINYCIEQGEDWQTVHGQMRYLQYELENGYKSVLNALRSVENTAQGAYDAGYVFCYRFEIPANREQKSDQRGRVARDEFWPRFGVDEEKEVELPDFTKYVAPEGSFFLYRLYNPNSGEHFYTGSEEESIILVKAGWNFEGEGFLSPLSGDPVYRFYDINGTQDHMYTADPFEVQYLTDNGWSAEPVAFNTATEEEGRPMYRLRNPNATVGAHHFTMSEEERDHLIDIGWIDEGIGWYSV